MVGTLSTEETMVVILVALVVTVLTIVVVGIWLKLKEQKQRKRSSKTLTSVDEVLPPTWHNSKQGSGAARQDSFAGFVAAQEDGPTDPADPLVRPDHNDVEYIPTAEQVVEPVVYSQAVAQGASRISGVSRVPSPESKRPGPIPSEPHFGTEYYAESAEHHTQPAYAVTDTRSSEPETPTIVTAAPSGDINSSVIMEDVESQVVDTLPRDEVLYLRDEHGDHSRRGSLAQEDMC